MRVSNWALNPRGFEFAELGAVFKGGLEHGVTITFVARDTKRLEAALSFEEAARLHDQLGALLLQERSK